MGTSCMNHVAELYFRLQPKPTEGEFEALLKLLRKRPEKPGKAPKAMGGRREDGPDGGVFYFREAGEGPVIFYCHGGSYVHGFSYFHWRLMRMLMDRTGATLVAPDYRLAPYGTWEEAFRLILPVYLRFVREQPDRKLILMGDSAGGGLAAALALELNKRGERAPDELILLSPWMDVTIPDEEVADFISLDPWLATSHRVCGRCWAGAADPRDPRVSPAYGSVEGLDHVTVFCGTREILNPDSVKLFARLDPAGDSELVVGEGMFHVYPLLPIPEARAAVEKMAEKILRERSK